MTPTPTLLELRDTYLSKKATICSLDIDLRLAKRSYSEYIISLADSILVDITSTSVDIHPAAITKKREDIITIDKKITVANEELVQIAHDIVKLYIANANDRLAGVAIRD